MVPMEIHLLSPSLEVVALVGLGGTYSRALSLTLCCLAVGRSVVMSGLGACSQSDCS